MTPEQFVKTWAGTQLKESASYITHFDDLCELLNHKKPAHMDKTGEHFTYQKGVTKTPTLPPPLDDSPMGEEPGGGRRGYADVWFDEHFAFEYKGANKHKDLAAAYRQLLLYKDALKNPPLLVVCDIEHYEVHTNFTNSVSKVYVFKNEDIASTKIIEGTRFTAVQLLDKLFRDPEALRPEQTIEGVTQDAAKKFTELADSMDKKHHIPHTQAARFLVKLVFCLFCEDVGLLPKGIFSKIVRATKDNPKEFSRHLRDLFGAMAEGNRMVWGETIYHFDGGLFAHSENDPDVVPFDGADTRILEDASKLNWADVDPSIFGTLFERALDIEGKRAQLGAHYTSRADIETLIEPVLMNPLRREWEDVKSKTADYLDWNLADRPHRSQRPVRSSEDKRAALAKLLHDFQDRLASITVLDPACGSGNFLYVSLSMLKDLEKQVITFALDVGIDDMEPRVHPSQLHGIEKDDFAFQLASIVVWIGYLQWKVKNGYAPAAETPILKPLNTIKQMDAILEIPNSKTQTPKEPEWDAADVIVGNPPFLGSSKLRSELGDEYVEALFKLYKDRLPVSDLCCYWFEKARAMIESGKAKRAGLLATQGIRGGANRTVLERIKQSGDIFWAESDRDWIQDGATVHVSMVGFDNSSEKLRTLDRNRVDSINSDLIAGVDLTKARTLIENTNICFRSDEKGGPFDIDAAQARRMLDAPLNPNGRPNSDVVRPYFNGRDVTQRWQNTWIIDFGCDTTIEVASLYELPFEYVKNVVKPVREKTRNEKERKFWWLHRRPAPDMRQAIEKLSRFIATPSVSKHRLFIWLSNETIPDHQLYVFAREDDFFFGVLHSKAHELWARATGTQLREAESGFRYTPTTCFETFPFPHPNAKQKEAIALAAKELNEKREHWLNPYKDEPSAIHEDLKKRTLTNLYNEMPTWLQLAHEKLDRAVLDAYGWAHDISDDDILAKLLAENLKREAVGDAKAEEDDEEDEKPQKKAGKRK